MLPSKGFLTVDDASLNVANHISVQADSCLAIQNEGKVSSATGLIGERLDSISTGSGRALVDGPSSVWTNSGNLIVGVGGSGIATLDITNGGTVRTGGLGIGTNGTVNLDGGTLELTDSMDFYGWDGTFNFERGTIKVSNGTINPLSSSTIGSGQAIVISGDNSRWESEASPRTNFQIDGGTLSISNGGSVVNSSVDVGLSSGLMGTVIVDGAGSSWTADITVGQSGSGRLHIKNQGAVNTDIAHIGNDAGTGTVMVDGEGSCFTNGLELVLGGGYSQGTLRIANGASVSSARTYVGYFNDSEGIVTIDGIGTNWTNSGDVYLGGGGSGIVNIEVGMDNILTIGGDFTNDGVVRLTADGGLAAGAYSPISVSGGWLGNGTYEAFGGVWDESAHTFTVAAAEQTSAGTQTTIDLAATQRVVVGGQLAMNFAAAGVSTSLDFTATETTGQTLTDLQTLIDPTATIEGSWDFDITGLPTGDEVLLSFAVVGSPDLDDLAVWHYDAATGWTLYDATDLTFSDGWASFTVDSFSSYAVTSVPEPATISLLAVGGVALLRRRRKG